MTFGERLRELRKQRGISQRKLAVLIEVSYTYIGKLENGIMPPPSAKIIHRMALALAADESELFALAGKVSPDALAQRLTDLEARYAEMGTDLEEMRELFDQLERKQIKEGPLAPLAQALAYHHETVCGWARLAAMGEPCNELASEFAKMYKVVTHYEYVAQQLLGINPSPLADLDG